MNVLTICCAALTLVLTGAMTGVFLAFSVSVMPGLDGVGAGSAVPAMRSMNQAILNPLFGTTFVGAPIAAVVTGLLLLWQGEGTAALLFFVVAAVYLLGAFLPTVAVNVPMNEALDTLRLAADPEQAARQWSDYSTRWTRWNSLRAVASALSLLLVGLAGYLWARQG